MPKVGTKPVVLDIRGGHGAGKTHIVQTITERFGKEEVGISGCWIIKKINAVVCRTDRGSDPETIQNKIDLGLRKGRLLIEGTISSHTKGRYLELARRLGAGYHFLFLNTPLETCIDRVSSRRTKTKNRFSEKPFNPGNVIKEYNSAQRIRKQLDIISGLDVRELDWENPLPTVYELLGVVP